MDETTPEIEQKIRELIFERSPSERVRMGCSMHATSKILMTLAILEQQPDATPADIRQQLFLKFYGGDYEPDERNKIVSFLSM